MLFLKFKRGDAKPAQYGILEGDRLLPVKGASTVPGLFGGTGKKSLKTERALDMAKVRLLPPTDDNAGVYCAGLNYSDHAREIKMPLPKSPIFFTKGPGSITGPFDDVIYPDETRLLDYEVELAVIIGRGIDRGDPVTEKNIGEYILGITILNDISARDIQLKSGQWFLGKSFRTFALTGPYIQSLTADALERLYDLDLSLQVSDSTGKPYAGKRQMGNTKNMVFWVHDLVHTLVSRFPLRPGDIIATGTPSGVALSRPGYLKSRLAEILGIPMGKRTAAFIDSEVKKNKNYLQRGDLITATISSSDGAVNLGVQKNRIV